ncbi:acylphosphatase [Oleidesulfovibrio alaskensis G20]|uniref:Acylphosphatase n=1 Tax=Oleidesulfovibrio alaskensis (strain ATCC BAA-1058 / DSM 17464 / G20) TaxID=207559 RepID=ACYP_OLEA2|nr:RecName: Full=Acylphosphatase; AltName: Full=Acylphosphate phosphohydrolase [Oleidesulfovibrio alaskensis G20]ABB39240.1 acylphosphatase [Oleidesulfovibrio alaskensis G20]
MNRIACTVHGRVQGVGFRYWTKRKAAALGLRGWVKNAPDGTVMLEAAGEAGLWMSLPGRCTAGLPSAP